MGRFIIAGPPCAGKSTYARQHMSQGDVIYDYDTVHQALSGRPSHQHDPAIRPYVLRARNSVIWLLGKNTEQSAWIITSSPKSEEVCKLRDSLNAEVVLLTVERDEAHRRCDADGRPAAWHEYIDNWFDTTDIDSAKFEQVSEGRNMKTDIERRIFTGEIRVVRQDGQAPLIRGYGAVFDALSENLGGFREKILPGAFADVLGDDVRGLFNHDPNKILGRSPDTLRLSEDDTGLSYEIDPPDTQYARDLLVSLERGDVDQSSFGFEVAEESWINPTDEEPLPIRVIHKVRKLWDVSPVVFPAYPQTSVAVRSMAETLRGQATGMDNGMSAAGRLALSKSKLRLIDCEV